MVKGGRHVRSWSDLRGNLVSFCVVRGVTRVKALFRRLDQPTMHHGSSSTFGNLYSFRLAQRRKYRTKEGNPDDTIVQVLSSTLESECTFIVVKLNFVGSNPTRSNKTSLRGIFF